MSGSVLLVLVVVVILCTLGAAVWAGRRRARERQARREAFEREHGLSASVRPAELGSRYLATGTVRGVAVTIESERTRRARGAGYVTRVRGTASAEVGPLVVLRRTMQVHDQSVGSGLPEQELDDPAFDNAFRTLCARPDEARAVLTAERRRLLLAQVGPLRFGITSLEMSGGEVVYTMAWTLCFGMQPELRDAVEAALGLVTDLCQAR